MKLYVIFAFLIATTHAAPIWVSKCPKNINSWHIVWKLLKKSHLNFFENSSKWTTFIAFLFHFCHSESNRNSLRSQCWWDFFCNFQTFILLDLFSTIIQDDIVNAVTGFAKKVTTGSANDLDEPKYRRVQIFNQGQDNQVITSLLM